MGKLNALKHSSSKPAKSNLFDPSTYCCGELVLWCKQPVWRPTTAIFARIGDLPDDSSVLIYINAEETESELVPFSQLLPMHPEMIDMLSNVKSMQKLVTDPVDEFFNKLTSDVKNKYVITKIILFV